MANLNDVHHQAWQAVNPNVPINEGSAIYKKWLDLKSQGVGIGAPVANEANVAEGGAAQAFSSGLVLRWNGSTVEVI